MPKFRFQWTDRRTPEGVWEEHNENEVVCQDSAASLASCWIESFNETEWIRYGASGAPRTITAVEFIGDGPPQHEWEKANSMTLGNDGHGHRDKWVCKVCGCVGLRYGLSQVIKRTGKWRAKKYEFCNVQE